MKDFTYTDIQSFIDNNTFVRILKFYCFVSPNCGINSVPYLSIFVFFIFSKHSAYPFPFIPQAPYRHKMSKTQTSPQSA